MREVYGQCRGPLLLLHGGAGPRDPDNVHIVGATKALSSISEKQMSLLKNGARPEEVVLGAVEAMELDPLFNAGVGSALQLDGVARLTAAYMDSATARFSGVIMVTDVANPVRMAYALQKESSRVLGPPGTERLARRLGLPVANCVTPKRVGEWKKAAGYGSDTVGCILRLADGRLFAAASTGGRGYEEPGRISDSATVAGTYCSPFTAVCATGIGEEIVDDVLAARLDTRVRDGMPLKEACQKALREATDKKRQYGWIALDQHGWAAAYTTGGMTFVVRDMDQEIKSSLTI